MLSFQLPQNIQIACTKNYIRIKHNSQTFIKKINNEVTFNLIVNNEGSRLFASSESKTKAASALSLRHNLVFGLSRGYQQRLRLVGIGFRSSINSITASHDNISSIDKLKLNTKKSIRDRFDVEPNKEIKYISRKLGYSHEVVYPINNNNEFNVSAIDGRSKGRLIDIKSNNYIQLNTAAAEIKSFRYPDAYKGKGIYFNNETLKLKKGKRQG